MALTSEFLIAVKNNNLLKVRIMLKDSLLVDKSFVQFKEMRMYLEQKGVNFWTEEKEELEIQPKEAWNLELMNLELTKLVNDFTEKHLEYCQNIIRKVYGITSNVKQTYPMQERMLHSPSVTYTQKVQTSHEEYRIILDSVIGMNRILKKNKTENGRIWRYDDIKKLQAEAKRLIKACEKIELRRD